MKKYLIAIVVTVLFSSSAFAAGYGEAGCGLGSLIFGDSSGPVQIFAATTNGSTYSQLFGITSGTSNCDASGIILASKEDGLFVAGNFDNLEKEMAVGKGEHLNTLAGLLGCPAEKSPTFASYAQENYLAIFAGEQTTPDEMLQTVRTGMSTHPELASACIQ
ncbi:DUF3015 domain-containing protein [Nitrospira defluvii]|nr:DUF3015 domain-containing protein [Nitrospira defluvii]